IVEVKPLLSIEGGKFNSPVRSANYANSVKRIVNPEAIIFPGSENHSRAELLVKIPHSNVKFISRVPCESIAYTGSFPGRSGRICHGSGQISFKSQTGRKLTVSIKNVAKTTQCHHLGWY